MIRSPMSARFGFKVLVDLIIKLLSAAGAGWCHGKRPAGIYGIAETGEALPDKIPLSQGSSAKKSPVVLYFQHPAY